MQGEIQLINPLLSFVPRCLMKSSPKGTKNAKETFRQPYILHFNKNSSILNNLTAAFKSPFKRR